MILFKKVSCIWSRFLLLALLFSSAAFYGCQSEIQIPNPHPKNPYLANSVFSVAHNDSAQQDSIAVPGPTGPTQELSEDQIKYQFIGPAHFGAYISSRYKEDGEDECDDCDWPCEFCEALLKTQCLECDCLPEVCEGRRVIWSNGGDRIVKLDHDTFEVIDTYPLPDKELWTNEEAEEVISDLEILEGDELITYSLTLSAKLWTGLAGVYAMLDKDGNFFVGSTTGITVYGDEVDGEPLSKITIHGTWDMPEEITGEFIGMNMTYDGWIILVTDHGYVIALARDLSKYRSIKMAHSEGAAEYSEEMRKTRVGYGWVRNPYAIDDEGGIYIVSNDHMHKVIWTGDGFSIDEKDGAWSEPYLNGWGFGSGSGVSLMGFGDEDKFVVITDGEDLMNIVLYWRDEIPADWQQLPGAPSRRIAGMLPANLGDPTRTEVQSEQSVIVSGYGAAIVNNEPASLPPNFPIRATGIFKSWLGNLPEYTPHGVQKFEWDPVARRFKEAWTNVEVASPNNVPHVSMCSNMLYTIGVREGKWTLEGLDWTTGESIFYWIIGGQRYNSVFSGLILDGDGRFFYGTPFGKVALEP